MTTPSQIYGLSSVAQQAIGGSQTTGISAAGTTQATATALTTDLNNVSTCAAGAGVLLPIGENGKTVRVYNGTANALLVYAPVGGTINQNATTLGYSIAAGTASDFQYTSTLTISAVSPEAMQIAQATIIATGTGQLTAAQTVGSQNNYIVLTVQGAATFATPNATNIFAGVPNAKVGQNFLVHFANQNSGTATISGGTGVTMTGTVAVQTALSRSFVVNLASATTVTFTNVSAT